MRNSVLLIVSIDTEEDNWYRSRQDVTCDNIQALRRQAVLFARLGLRPTYFTSYHVARDPRAADVIREVGAAGEIAAHLHPWNTPPLSEAFLPRNSMLKNLPAELQLAKLETLTTTLEEVFGARPEAFRAGRYGLGPDTVSALARCGYVVDSSVTPFVSWKDFDEGPAFFGVPLDVYRLGPHGVIEVPLSCGFARGPFALWDRLHRALDRPGLRRARALCKRIMLSPETATAEEMLTLSRRLLERGVRHLHITWHSPSLQPGLGPFTQTPADVDRLYGAVETYLDRLEGIATLNPVTVSEAAAVETAAC